MEARGIRRVVTGHDANGTAVVQSDGMASNVRVRATTGTRSTLVWTTNTSPPCYADDDRGAVEAGVAPPYNGTTFRIVEFPGADPGQDSNNAAIAAEMGLHHDTSGRRPPRHPAMHATDSVDYAIVLDGEIDMLLDETEVHLRAGDVIVQQGTNHAWVNRGDAPCRIAFVLMGTKAPVFAQGARKWT
jgi:mannose-6-phosphate isomerase-like protein (cupin superfamily)